MGNCILTTFGSVPTTAGPEEHSSFIFAFRLDELEDGSIGFEQVQMPVEIRLSDFSQLVRRTMGNTTVYLPETAVNDRYNRDRSLRKLSGNRPSVAFAQQ